MIKLEPSVIEALRAELATKRRECKALEDSLHILTGEQDPAARHRRPDWGVNAVLAVMPFRGAIGRALIERGMVAHDPGFKDRPGVIGGAILRAVTQGLIEIVPETRGTKRQMYRLTAKGKKL